ncbi:PREDICTED: voltage-dependent calcium channel gamma-1 subunit [Bison bison bison]|uniref:Voltage-dependent calcium channel gamma-1 subunit n=1 Tax=Bison bison bison TaxID=43346 RepID=A0A6P3IKB7_BISBB|nr:PREDICTED: voltage-dependent calcium channel gamma-1 subunit [Bison bison bison]
MSGSSWDKWTLVHLDDSNMDNSCPSRKRLARVAPGLCPSPSRLRARSEGNPDFEGGESAARLGLLSCPTLVCSWPPGGEPALKPKEQPSSVRLRGLLLLKAAGGTRRAALLGAGPECPQVTRLGARTTLEGLFVENTWCEGGRLSAGVEPPRSQWAEACCGKAWGRVREGTAKSPKTLRSLLGVKEPKPLRLSPSSPTPTPLPQESPALLTPTDHLEDTASPKPEGSHRHGHVLEGYHRADSKPEAPVGLAHPLLASSRPSCSPFSQLSPSFAEKNCSYFRHFNPGESSEIFEVTTQKEYSISAAAIAIFSLGFIIVGTLCALLSFRKKRDYLLRPASMFYIFAGRMGLLWGYSPDTSQRQGGGNVRPAPPNGKENEKRSRHQGCPHLSERRPQSLRPGGPTCRLQKSRCEPLAETPIPGTQSHALWVS